MVNEKPLILAPNGKAARKKDNTDCPKCHADASKRVLSSGFGQPHDVCSQCGYDFPERTL